MENQSQMETIKLAVLESQLNNLKSSIDRIELQTSKIPELNAKIVKHDTFITGILWSVGIIVSFVVTKFVGKF